MINHIPLPFIPSNNRRRREVVVLEKAFSQDELNWIRAGCSQLQLEEGKVGPDRGEGVYHDRRSSKIAWIGYEPGNDHSVKLYGKVLSLLNSANLDLGLDIWGFAEPLQYAEYHGPNGRFCWHTDSGISEKEPPRPPRKISFTLQLSRPDEYEGGAFEILGIERMRPPRDAGTMIIFPSYMTHRVDTILSGIRRSLVGWVAGPDFR